MKFSFRTIRRLLPLFLASLIILEGAAYVATTPRPREGFFELYALGANGIASDYYPNNSSFIQPGEPVTWYIGLSNQMGSVQFVDIRVKLGNQTINPPNDTNASPSPAPLIVEFKRFISDNATWEIPFVWQILNFSTQGNHSRLLELQIDNVSYLVPNAPTCSVQGSCSLRFIFELWTWNVSVGDFQMGWWNGDQQRIAWLQIWFNPTPGAP
jgi:hypothetical protein